jgi:hypothetical protein
VATLEGLDGLRHCRESPESLERPSVCGRAEPSCARSLL